MILEFRLGVHVHEIFPPSQLDSKPLEKQRTVGISVSDRPGFHARGLVTSLFAFPFPQLKNGGQNAAFVGVCSQPS